ncbi:MAG: MarC family protein [Spirochaetota bacterium]|nr:MarC family protein [Spirochaetota bacterium]
MDANFIPTVFFTLFFVVDPLGLIPAFIIYLSGYESRRQRLIILRATGVAASVSVFFVLFGKVFLNFLGITPASFLFAGGILLFLISMDMLFARPTRTKVSKEDIESPGGGDTSVFPLAIPMLCGPGNIAALLMFSSQADGDTGKIITIVTISVIMFIIAGIVMFFSVFIERLLGETGLSVIQRIMGLILSAMAVQFIINGLNQIGIISLSNLR